VDRNSKSSFNQTLLLVLEGILILTKKHTELMSSEVAFNPTNQIELRDKRFNFEATKEGIMSIK
jgi:hypothetical protein